jgi:hypothetical protein
MLIGQAALADPRLAPDQEDAATPEQRGFQGHLEVAQLRLTPDEFVRGFALRGTRSGRSGSALLVAQLGRALFVDAAGNLECGILTQDRPVKILKRPAGLDPELLD